ncbi:TAXI family TRAP transporter solute-binding subunit [Paraburkholderia silviterrae]|nr:TAXI family TRAP transporter solute-binding subunit [Paraburkholderia silviterrae]
MNRYANPKFRLRCALAVLVLGAVVYATVHVLPDRLIRIAAGPIGGSFYDTALQYRRIVEARGFRVDIVPFQNTDEIYQKVADPSEHLDVGFVSEDLNKASDASLVSLGDIQLQPIFFFVNRNAEHGQAIRSFTDLRGLSIVLPPQRSLTSRTMKSILALYGIDATNTRIDFFPLSEAIARLKRGDYEAGLFILGADSQMIADLAEDANLELVQPAELEAIAKKLGYLKVVTLPAGVLDLARHIPDHDVSMLAATISVVAKQDMSAATQYALLEAMQEVHRGGSYVNRSGEFPRYAGNAGPVADTVAGFYRNGTPWIYAHFPSGLASVVDAYLAPLLALSFIFSALHIVTEFEGLKKFALLSVARVLVWRLRRQRGAGVPPGARTMALARLIESNMVPDEDHTRHWIKALREAIRT